MKIVLIILCLLCFCNKYENENVDFSEIQKKMNSAYRHEKDLK